MILEAARPPEAAPLDPIDTSPLPPVVPSWTDEIQPHAAQLLALASIARFLNLCAGVRGGKTLVAAHKFCERLREDVNRAFAEGKTWTPVMQRAGDPALTFWVVSPTYALLEQAQRNLKTIIDRSGWDAQWREKHGDLHKRCWLGSRGVLIEFKSADRDNLVSVSVNGAWMDEVARMKPAAYRTGVRGRVTDTLGWIITSTSPLGPNWYFEDLFQRGAPPESEWYDPVAKDPEFQSIHWFTSANPSPKIQADLAVAKRTLAKRYWVREYEASFTAFQGQVWENLVIQKVERSSYYRVVAGVDFGHAAPGAIVVVALYYQGGKVCAHVLAEEYHSRISTPEWIALARRLHGLHRIERFYGDPAAAQLIADWAQAGLPMEHVKSLNAVAPGIRSVDSLFVQKRLTIDPRCVNLIREARGYRYHEAGDGTTTDIPVKQNDHAPDALRLAIHAEHLRGTFADLALAS